MQELFVRIMFNCAAAWVPTLAWSGAGLCMSMRACACGLVLHDAMLLLFPPLL
jgi:hypothetical protein